MEGIPASGCAPRFGATEDTVALLGAELMDGVDEWDARRELESARGVGQIAQGQAMLCRREVLRCQHNSIKLSVHQQAWCEFAGRDSELLHHLIYQRGMRPAVQRDHAAAESSGIHGARQLR